MLSLVFFTSIIKKYELVIFFTDKDIFFIYDRFKLEVQERMLRTTEKQKSAEKPREYDDDEFPQRINRL